MSKILDAAESASSSSSDSECEDGRSAAAVGPSYKAAFLRRINAHGNEKTAEAKSAPADFFFVDTDGANGAPSAEAEAESSDLAVTTAPLLTRPSKNNKKKSKKPLIDLTVRHQDEVDKILATAVLQPDYDRRAVPDVAAKSLNQQKKQRKLDREKTAGRSWDDMPATELTDERRRDLELLRMRGALDPLSHYRKMDRDTLPKYFQMGEIVENKSDYYASRLTKKQRKRTMVEELMVDMETVAKAKRKYTEIQLRRTAPKRRGASFTPLAPGASKRARFNKNKLKVH